MELTRCSTLRDRLRKLMVCAAALVGTSCWAATINVGAGQAYTTIQAGINAANNGDTVLVAPGTYYENIDFKGKAITVTSSGGAASTIIDGGGTAPAVNFKTSETRSSVLSGFTVQHGGVMNYTVFVNGGIYLSNSSPSILNNVLTQNYCWTIYSTQSSPLIQGNEISATQDPHGRCSFGGGAGIYVSGNLNGSVATVGRRTSAISPLILGNTIENNVESGLEDAGGNGGAGIAVWGGSPIIMNNLIRNNASPGGSGGAINVENGQGVAIVQNVIYGNSAGCGGGALAYLVGADPVTGIAILIANNTIVNDTDQGFPAGYSECAAIAQIYPGPDTYGGSNPFAMIINNIVSGSTSYAAVNCDWFSGPNAANESLYENDILYNGGGPFFGSYCIDVSAQNGNIAADPHFNNPSAGDYHLTLASPAIDGGQNAVLQSFESLTGLSLLTDFDGKQRIQEATGQNCIIDMGAYEYAGTPGACGTTETLQSSLNPSTYGQSVTLTAQLGSANGVPTGDVQFLDGNTVLATQTISATGTSSYVTSALAVGSHAIVATYQPTGVFSAASATLTQVVNGIPTATSLSCSPNPVAVFGVATFTARGTSTGGAPLGSFAFTDNGSALGQINGPTAGAIYLYTAQTVGTHQIGVTFAPVGGFAGSSASCAEVVTALPTTAVLTVTPTGSTYGQPVTLSAAVAPVTAVAGHAPTGTVSFTWQAVNSALSAQLGTVPLNGAGVAVLNLATLPGGAGVLSCQYSGDSAFAGSSCTGVADTVAPAATTFTVSSSLNPAPALSAVTFTAHLAVSGGGVPPVGSAVSLSLNNQAIALATDANGNATYTTSALVAGTYAVSAGFGGTGDLTASSAALTEVVTLIPTATTLTAAPNPAYAGQAVTLTALATGTSASQPLTGSVTFFDGGNALGSASMNGAGVASLIVTTLAVGTHPLTAVYAAGPVFAGSTSPVVQAVVLASGFGVAVVPNVVSIQAGLSTTAAVQLTSLGGFSGPLTLSVGSLPMNMTATIAPASVTLASGGTGASVLTLNTRQMAESVAPRGPGGSRRWPVVLAATVLLALPWSRRRGRRLRGVIAAVGLMGMLQTLSGCTDSYAHVELVATGTYTVVVTATDAHQSAQSAVLTVAITH